MNSAGSDVERNFRWVERAKIAALLMAAYVVVGFVCLITSNPLFGQKNVLMFIALLVEVICLICFCIAISEKKFCLLLPILIEQGIELTVRIFYLAIGLFNHLKRLSTGARPRNSKFKWPDDNAMSFLLIYAYLLPVYLICFCCFIKCFAALRSWNQSAVGIEFDSREFKRKAWIERTKVVTLWLCAHFAVIVLCRLTQNAVVQKTMSKQLTPVIMMMDWSLWIEFFLLFLVPVALKKKQRWYLLPILIERIVKLLCSLVLLAMAVVIWFSSERIDIDFPLALLLIGGYLAPIQVVISVCFYKCFFALRHDVLPSSSDAATETMHTRRILKATRGPFDMGVETGSRRMQKASRWRSSHKTFEAAAPSAEVSRNTEVPSYASVVKGDPFRRLKGSSTTRGPKPVLSRPSLDQNQTM